MRPLTQALAPHMSPARRRTCGAAATAAAAGEARAVGSPEGPPRAAARFVDGFRLPQQQVGAWGLLMGEHSTAH